MNLSYHQNNEPAPVCIVRLSTSAWKDKRGIHQRKSLTFLRKQCKGHNIVEDDADAVDPNTVVSRILNLNQCEDGIYEVAIRNEFKDHETGYVEEWDYELVPVTKEAR